VVLIVGGLAIANHKTAVIGVGGEILIFVLGFGFIPDLLDGHGEDVPKPGRLSKFENEIRDILGNLSVDFHDLHDVESPHGTIRHIVFSRNAGVFLIEAKLGRNCLKIDDGPLDSGMTDPEPHVLDQCVERAYWVRDQITEIVGEKPWITPLLVLPNAFVPQDLKIGSVHIVNAASLLPTLSENGGRRRKSTHIWDARTLIADSLLG